MAKLSREDVVTIGTLAGRGFAVREIGRKLGVSEGAVRYQLRRRSQGAVDGRSRQQFLAAGYREAIDAYLEALGQESPENVADLFEFLVREHDYPGSLRSVQRYVRAAFPAPPVRARRRVETPPGAQAQADWAHFPRVLLEGRELDLLAFVMVLSFSRADVVIWSRSKAQLSWLGCHNQAFERYQGVPATVRVDNEKTAVARGAGPWGVLNPAYARYAQQARFHIDPCLPRAPEAKGKVERRILDRRLGCSPYTRAWGSLQELQAWSDERGLSRWETRVCPATGSSVLEAFAHERPWLGPLPVLPEPFDISVTRRVGKDAIVHFEGRQYNVPIAFVDRPVEVRGCASSVQVLADATVVAEHQRHTRERIVLNPAYYDTPSTDRVIAPPPLGRMGKALQAIADTPPEHRPVDLYAHLAEAAK
jgi:transposase